MTTPILPSFSLPLTRTDFNALLIKLTANFQNQGFSENQSKTFASQVISSKEQGLTDAQIQKNFQDTTNFTIQRDAERKAQILIEQQKQQPLLDELARAKAQRIALVKSRGDRESRNLQQIRNFGKTNIILVANPDNPRGTLIPKSEADLILRKRINQGKDTGSNSLAQKNDPSIIDRIRESLIPKTNEQATVIDVNRSFVQLSNGQLVARSQFTGVIPQKFLDAEKITVKIPTADNAPFGGVTTFGGVKKIIDPTKTIIKISDPTKFIGALQPISLPTQVQAQLDFLQQLSQNTDSKVFDPLGDLAKFLTSNPIDISKPISDIQNSFAFLFPTSTQTKVVNPTETKPFDPLGDLVNFFTSKTVTTETKPFDPLGDLVNFFTSKTVTSLPVAPKPTDPTKIQLPIIPDNKPEPPIPELKTVDKITNFISKNGIKIVVGGISTIVVLGLLLTMLPKNNGILEKRLN